MNVCTCDTHLPHVYFGARDERSYMALPKTNWKYREGWKTNHSTGRKNSTITGVHSCYGNAQEGHLILPKARSVWAEAWRPAPVSGGRGWELEHPWLQISWSRFSECLAEPRGFPGAQEPLVWVWVTWGSFCWVYSSWWSNCRALGIWSQERPGPFPPSFLQFDVENQETWSPYAAFLLKLSQFLTVLVASALTMANTFIPN